MKTCTTHLELAFRRVHVADATLAKSVADAASEPLLRDLRLAPLRPDLDWTALVQELEVWFAESISGTPRALIALDIMPDCIWLTRLAVIPKYDRVDIWKRLLGFAEFRAAKLHRTVVRGCASLRWEHLQDARRQRGYAEDGEQDFGHETLVYFQKNICPHMLNF